MQPGTLQYPPSRPGQCLFGFCGLLLVVLFPGQLRADDGLLALLETELNRSMQELGSQPVPPYFLAYRVADQEQQVLAASFGALEREYQRASRRLYVESRTGTYERDNTHAMRSDGFSWGINYRGNWTDLPLQDDPAAIRAQIWQATDRVYQQSVEHLGKVQANTIVKVDEEDQSNDFSRESPVTHLEPVTPLEFQAWTWQDRVRRYSRRFAGDARILVGRVSISAEKSVQRFVNTEGTRIRQSSRVFRLVLTAMAKADDGMELPLSRTFLARSAAELPSDEEVMAAIDQMMALLSAMETAPIVTAYQGPVLLEGRASAVFFHELLGHRVEGHRLRREEDSQTFKRKIGERILPPGFDVYFDPTVESHQGTSLMGSYRVDDEGVRARRVDVVSDGVLKEFLMSRIPIDGHPGSNGHGRAQTGSTPVARQSNLFVRSRQAVPAEELRRKFVETLERQERDWGLVIRDVRGGLTSTRRTQTSALQVVPTEVYRLYRDGREELVRGVDVIGTPLLTLSHLAAAADSAQVFHGWCGAESGSLPVSLVAPSVLLDRLEVQRKSKSQSRRPLLPNPVPEDQ
ncbi:MAG: TldD/PmbA family protein [Xanthomonadales bacterium]|nr:TldD/PmbA family protein [Xanthomonadales bacterium]